MASNNGTEDSSDERLKKRLLWEKVNDPKFIEESISKKGGRSSPEKATVPMISSDLLRGSTNDVSGNRVFNHLSSNPLVPLGMVATVGCLIGMCKSSLNRNMMKTQYYMRGRLAAQFFTVCALVGGAMFLGVNSKRGSEQTPSPESEFVTKALLANKS